MVVSDEQSLATPGPMKPETVAAQALHSIDPATGAVVPAIHLATTYARDADYALRGPSYARDQNPTPLLAVASTCATPVHTQPIALGADLVMHAATKYLAGHSDVLAGALVTARADAAWAQIVELRHDEGPCLGPVEAYLLTRGMRTLFARVERSSRTAQFLATELAARGITVRYPGLPSHPQHAIAARQIQRGFGSMLSIQVGGGAERALAVIKRL